MLFLDENILRYVQIKYLVKDGRYDYIETDDVLIIHSSIQLTIDNSRSPCASGGECRGDQTGRPYRGSHAAWKHCPLK